MTNRGTLMALLAASLLAMGTSLYLLWFRIQNIFFAPALPAAASVAPLAEPQNKKEPAPVPAASNQNEPDLPAPTPAEPPATQKKEGHPLKKISLQFRDSLAKRVSVISDFNQWSPQLMKKEDDYQWSVTVELEPGEYAYNFIVDGQLIRDPSNKKTKKTNQKIPSSLLVVPAK